MHFFLGDLKVKLVARQLRIVSGNPVCPHIVIEIVSEIALTSILNLTLIQGRQFAVTGGSIYTSSCDKLKRGTYMSAHV